jgi:hypothetical protein
MRVYKQQIIEAMKTEDLKAGTYNEDDNSTCAVCAVGAVFRLVNINDRHMVGDALFKSSPYPSLSDHNAVVMGAHTPLEDAPFLVKLSYYFERNFDEENPDSIRPKLVRFVKKHCPKYIDIDFENPVAELANILGYDYDETKKMVDEGEFIILSDKEADELARERILDSLWAFSVDFLAAHIRIPQAELIVLQLQHTLYEEANEPIKALIHDLDHFVEDAINADGRGDVISTYDGDEIELPDTKKYAYRL